MCGSEPVMGALENSTGNSHSSVRFSSDKCAFSNSGNSAENVTKANVHVLSNPCEPVISSETQMFEPKVTVTCQDGCSQISQPQNAPNENNMFAVIKCLSQVITKFDNVFAGSSPNENENVHSPNAPMSSPKSEVIYEKSLSEN